MRIGVISDSHDNLPALRRAVAHFVRLEVEALLHAGDLVAPFAAKLLAPPEAPQTLPVHVCYGNNDGEKKGLKQVLPQIVDGPLRLSLGGRTIVMHHFIDWLKPKEIAGADLVITGHTHEIVNEKKGGTLYLNPGECGGWLTGQHTAALVDLEKLEAQIIQITV